MTPLRNRHRMGWFAAGVVLVVAASAVLLRPRQEPPAPVPVSATSSAPDSRSCKPSPPVQLTLSGMARGIWRIHLQPLESVEDAVLRMGSGAPGAESRVTEVWRGALRAGEARDIDARYEPPPGDAEVWAELAADERGGALLRSRAGVQTRGGVAVIAAQPADSGRVVSDPQSGTNVVEYPGGTGGNR